MNEIVLNGFFIISAALISGILTFLATRSSAEISKLKERHITLEKKLAKVLRQIEAYHLLEDLYANHIMLEINCSPRTVKSDFRNNVVEIHHCDRPSMSANEARKAID